MTKKEPITSKLRRSKLSELAEIPGD